MFDFSFGEIVLVGLVALVVLGPERLPKAARFVGLWVRRARAQWYSVKSELERELASEELRRSLADGRQVMRETEAELRATEADISSAVSNTVAEVRAPLAAMSATAGEAPEGPPSEQPAPDPVGLPTSLPAEAFADTSAQTPAATPTEDSTGSPRQDAHGR